MSGRTSDAYDSRSVVFHWATALLVVLQWVGAQVIDWFPRGPLRVDARSVHIVVGILLLTIVIMRLVWRLTQAQRPEPAGPKAVRTVASLVHWLLYALVIAVLLVGVVTEAARGDSFFGLFKIPGFQADRPLRSQLESVHELLANSLLIVAGAHAVAALVHGWLWRDRVLGRMIPALRRRYDARSAQ